MNLKADIEAFLANGGKITKIPYGVSVEYELSANGNIEYNSFDTAQLLGVSVQELIASQSSGILEGKTAPLFTRTETKVYYKYSDIIEWRKLDV